MGILRDRESIVMTLCTESWERGRLARVCKQQVGDRAAMFCRILEWRRCESPAVLAWPSINLESSSGVAAPRPRRDLDERGSCLPENLIIALRRT
jgi:hypothetical protein